MLVAASSKQGKSYLVRDILLNHYSLIDKPLESIIWLYHKNSRDDELFETLKKELNVPIEFMEGFPAEEISQEKLFKGDGLKCLVLDDVVTTALKSPVFVDLFTVISHHSNVCIIAILQNIFCETSGQRQIMNNIIRNLTYLVLFPDRRQMAACKQIARTYFNGEEYKLVRPFKELIDTGQKHTYMLIDLENANIRFNCLRPTDEAFAYVFAKED